MKIFNQKNYTNDKVPLDNGRKQAKYYPLNKLAIVTSTNTVPNNNSVNRPKTYNKRSKFLPKTKKDMQRLRNTLLKILNLNFNMNGTNVFFFTMEFKDQRLKSVNTARKRALAFLKKIGVDGVGIVELNDNHHPHCHVIITSNALGPFEIKDKWKNIGISNITNVRGNESWDRIANYLVKIYKDGESTTFNKDKATLLMKQRDICKYKYSEAIINWYQGRDPKWGKIYGKNRANYDRYKSLLKKERQKQLMVGDNPLIRTRGLSDKPLIIEDGSIINSIAKNDEFISSNSSKTIGVNEETGELLFNIRYQTNQYKINDEKLISNSEVI